MPQDNSNQEWVPGSAKPLPELTNECIACYRRHVDKTSKFGPKGDCWNYTGMTDKDGYGIVQSKSKRLRATRVGYFIHHGVDPFPHLILHSCDNPPCQNPDHWSLGSTIENRADCVNKGRTATGKKNGRYTTPQTTARGERNGCAKLSEKDVREIRELKNAGMSYSKLAKKFSVTPSAIWFIWTRKKWAHVK